MVMLESDNDDDDEVIRHFDDDDDSVTDSHDAIGNNGDDDDSGGDDDDEEEDNDEDDDDEDDDANATSMKQENEREPGTSDLKRAIRRALHAEAGAAAAPDESDVATLLAIALEKDEARREELLAASASKLSPACPMAIARVVLQGKGVTNQAQQLWKRQAALQAWRAARPLREEERERIKNAKQLALKRPPPKRYFAPKQLRAVRWGARQCLSTRTRGESTACGAICAKV